MPEEMYAFSHEHLHPFTPFTQTRTLKTFIDRRHRFRWSGRGGDTLLGGGRRIYIPTDVWGQCFPADAVWFQLLTISLSIYFKNLRNVYTRNVNLFPFSHRHFSSKLNATHPNTDPWVNVPFLGTECGVFIILKGRKYRGMFIDNEGKV